MDQARVRDAALALLDYCRRNDWAGYDPYDALNSRVFRATPFFRSRLCRIAFTQFMKRSPIDFRPMLGVPRKRNPKGTALFISALLNLRKAHVFSDDAAIHALIDDLIASRSGNQSLSCWGYSFDWQTRGYLVPEGSPNIVCTTFAGHALLDAWGAYERQDCLDHAAYASRFLIEELCEDPVRGSTGADDACFNYTPIASSRIHNANLLGAAYIARVAKATGGTEVFDLVYRATRYSVGKQAPDGSWPYGEHPAQRWIDSFHTGFNLCALQTVTEQTGSDEFSSSIRKGLAFYMGRFFLPDGMPRYYSHRTYPIDTHSAAQGAITLSRFAGLSDTAGLRDAVLSWTLAHMRDPAGYFYFQRRPLGCNRIPYMRWSQAWMLLALSTCLDGS